MFAALDGAQSVMKAKEMAEEHRSSGRCTLTIAQCGSPAAVLLIEDKVKAIKAHAGNVPEILNVIARFSRQWAFAHVAERFQDSVASQCHAMFVSFFFSLCTQWTFILRKISTAHQSTEAVAREIYWCTISKLSFRFKDWCMLPDPAQVSHITTP